MNRLKTLATGLVPLIFAPPAHALNVGLSTPPNYRIENLGPFVTNAIGLALVVAGILVFVYLVWGGIQWISSGGDKAKTEEARSRITAALVGLAIVAAAWAIMQLIAHFFGLNLADPELPTAFD